MADIPLNMYWFIFSIRGINMYGVLPRLWGIAFCVGLVLTGCAKFEVGPSTQFDILIKNGKMIAGTGNPWRYADIGIVGDTIVAIGDLAGKKGNRVIDAGGMVVTPGFIDMHTHTDEGFANKDLSANLNYLLQGVTTVRTGADGYGSYKIAATKKQWEDNGMGTNAVMLAGHSVIRREVMAEDQFRKPTVEELEKMKMLVRQAMREGAWGLSAQLEYGGYNIYVDTDEMVELAKQVVDYNGFYISHIRDEASRTLHAVKESIAIGKRAGVRVSVTHIKVTGRNNWGLMRYVVAAINTARAEGIDISADQYPFLQGAPIDYITSLIDVPRSLAPLYSLRKETLAGDMTDATRVSARERYVEALQAALQDPRQRQLLQASTYEQRLENPSAVARWGWQDFRIKVAVKNSQVRGKNIADLAEEQNRDGFDIVAELVISEPDILFAAASQSPQDMRHAMVQDWVMISSDGLTAAAAESYRDHPRSFASQAIIFRKFVREEKLLTLEDAVRKMTSLPAQLLGMNDRGLLLENYKADIAIFDPEKFQDQATYDDARQYAAGMGYVIVNGKVAVEQGKFNGIKAGEVLLKR